MIAVEEEEAICLDEPEDNGILRVEEISAEDLEWARRNLSIDEN